MQGVQILGPAGAGTAEILTDEAISFVVSLHREHNSRRKELLAARKKRAEELGKGAKLDFLKETAAIRASNWTVAPVPADLQDRRIEITGPIDRKMIINALNSGAKVFMADFEDSNTPTWENTISGQVNLRDAVRRTISFSQEGGKEYKLNDKVATLFVRPRGWHLTDKHFLVDGEPVSASLLDFGLYFFHNHAELKRRGTGPYFYLPKLESHLEARLWNDVFVQAQELLAIPAGTIRATVLIETILAAFEMDEILYELRAHSAGLNCGRWDYIFSCIKKFGSDPHFVLADRALVTMTTHFMRAYSQLLIKTCHRREIHAMGGMAAQIPIKNNPKANEEALAKVRADKEREATDGHDGTWVAHPALVPIAVEAFDKHMPGPNQISRKREDVNITSADLLHFEPAGPITRAGLRININVAIQYIGSWLGGVGCVPIFNLMEDAATAEICRSQVWQWVHSPLGVLDDGTKVDIVLVKRLVGEELLKIQAEDPDDSKANYARAAKLFLELVEPKVFTEFLTLPAYGLIA
jgi:malate synthase